MQRNMNTEKIYLSKAQLSDALALSKDLLADIELSRRPLSTIALSASRLARLLDDQAFQKVFEYESAGYPNTGRGFAPDIWELLTRADRLYREADPKDETKIKELAYGQSIEELEQQLVAYHAALENAKDPNVSISSANPNQYILNPSGNRGERNSLLRQVAELTKKVSQRRHFLCKYVLAKNMELSYTSVIDDILQQNNFALAERLQTLAPAEVQKFNAIYDNLRSDNVEDWANAVHSCRRLLQSVADVVQPPGEDITKEVNGKQKSIKMGKENYINRLIAYIESKTPSETFTNIVGSNIAYIGDRLDAIFQSAQKGSHSAVSRYEAERYVVYTFLALGDILSL